MSDTVLGEGLGDSREGESVQSRRLSASSALRTAISGLSGLDKLGIAFLAGGGALHATAQSLNFMGYIGSATQESLKLAGLFLLFVPAVYVVRRSFERPLVKWLVFSGLGAEFIHICLDISDDTVLSQYGILFNDAQPVHIVLQEFFHGAALTLLLGALYYFIVSYQSSEANLSLERDALRAEVGERANTEKALERSEAMFRTLVQGTSDAFIVVDSEGNIRYATDSIRRIAGYDPVNQLLGRRFMDFVLRSCDTVNVVDAAIDNPEPGSSQRYELQFAHCTGKACFLEVVVTNLLRSPSIRGIVVHARDVTERRSLEEQLRRSQNLGTLGALSGGIAHDFKNILTGLLIRCDRLLDDETCPDTIRNEVQLIRRTSYRGAALAKKMLSYTRRAASQLRVIDINASMRDIEEMVRGVLGDDVRIVLNLRDAPICVSIDPVDLEQVLINLITNARDAMPTGGRLELATDVLSAEHADPELPAGEFAVVTVADTGCGIRPEHQSRIFEPFFSTKEPSARTGLGLSTVYRIIEHHGGSIRVYTKPSHGTTFKVLLPTAKTRIDRAMSTIGGPSIERGVETILLAEDSEEVRRLTKSILLEKGYQVLEAEDYEGALRMSERHAGPIHLLLTDIVMMGRSGPELAESIVAQRPNVSVLYMSGYSGDVIRRYTDDYETSAHIEKPFTSCELLAKVRTVLDEAQRSGEKPERSSGPPLEDQA